MAAGVMTWLGLRYPAFDTNGRRTSPRLFDPIFPGVSSEPMGGEWPSFWSTLFRARPADSLCEGLSISVRTLSLPLRGTWTLSPATPYVSGLL